MFTAYLFTFFLKDIYSFFYLVVMIAFNDGLDGAL